MANYQNIIAAIESVIKQNGNQEITGQILQQSLVSIIHSLGAQYQFAGFADSETNPGTPDHNVAYIAGPGTYPNFNAYVVPDGFIAAFLYNGNWDVKFIAFGGGGGGGTSFVPEPDDLTLSSSILKFANRSYNNQNPNGLGYFILRKAKSFAEQVTQENTIYEIRYDFDLGGSSVSIPANCILKFVGGSLTNGTLVGNATKIDWNGGKIFDTTTTLSGTYNNDLNPLMFGIGESDALNYAVLKKTYDNAHTIGRNVIWNGVPDFTIDVPANPTSIRLTEQNDFNGVKITLKNTSARFVLFRMTSSALVDINIDKAVLSDRNLNYTSTNLPKSPCLLIVKDDNVWTPRTGYSDFYRRDIIFLENQWAFNAPIRTYNNTYSSPSCKYVLVSANQKTIKNLKIVRLATSTYITLPVVVEECFNVKIENIYVETESGSTLSTDIVINLTNCHTCYFDNISINGLFDYSGSSYGIELVNCANIKISRFNERNEKWGIMGSNNVNGLTVEDSNLNRVDLHCYGANFYLKNCVFRDLYNQLTGGYGNFIFEKCQFLLSLPYLSDGTSNVYTEFNLIYKDCEFKLASSNSFGAGNTLIYFNSFNENANSRAELADKYLPNIRFQNCNVVCSGAPQMFKGLSANVIYKGKFIEIDGMSMAGLNKSPFSLSDTAFTVAGNITLSVNKLDLIQVSDADITAESDTYQTENSLSWQTITGGNTLTLYISNSRVGINYALMKKHKICAKNSVIRGIRGNSDMLPSVFDDCIIYLTCRDDASSSIYEIPQLAEFNRCHFIRANSEWSLRVYRAGKTTFNECTKDTTDAILVNGLSGADELFGVSVLVGGLPPTWEMTYKTFGASSNRPTLGTYWRCKYYDITIGKLILWNGSAWTNSDGSAL